MPAEVRIFPTGADLAESLADEIVERHDRISRLFTLGCPGGRSLRATYRSLATRARLERLAIVMMDEYVGAPPDAHYSCGRFAREEIGAPLGVPPERILVPDAADPTAHELAIEALGGIDLFLLASGSSDGHIAFLPPGSPRNGRTSVVELAESTRRDNVATFPDFGSVNDVPRQGVSVGLATIAGARTLRLVLAGAEKRDAARHVRALGRFDPGWPASIVHDHADAAIWLDAEAAA